MRYTRSVLLCVLASGSGGNSILVEGGGTKVLLDAGLTLKETRRRCARAGTDARDVSDVFLTHEHADHAQCAGVLARKLHLRVHATRGTFEGLYDRPPEDLCARVRAGAAVDLGGLRVQPFAVAHDAREPVGYVFEEAKPDGTTVRAGVVTDLGRVTANVVQALRGLDALVLEMNHDVPLLLEGPYPWSLKQRIRGGFGHLSNGQGAKLLSRVLHPGLRHLVLAHLSEQNNTPDHARREAEPVLERAGTRTAVHVGTQVRALEPLEIRSQRRPRQLALFAERAPV